MARDASTAGAAGVSFARGETRVEVVPKEVRSSVYRGAIWQVAEVGHGWVAAAEVGSLILAAVLVLAGLAWPAIAALGVAMGLGIWINRRVEGWAEAHNTRVAAWRRDEGEARRLDRPG